MSQVSLTLNLCGVTVISGCTVRIILPASMFSSALHYCWGHGTGSADDVKNEYPPFVPPPPTSPPPSRGPAGIKREPAVSTHRLLRKGTNATHTHTHTLTHSHTHTHTHTHTLYTSSTNYLDKDSARIYSSLMSSGRRTKRRLLSIH